MTLHAGVSGRLKVRESNNRTLKGEVNIALTENPKSLFLVSRDLSPKCLELIGWWRKLSHRCGQDVPRVGGRPTPASSGRGWSR